eukprot:8840840-Pyramimonas_sp.AAC.1
MAPVVAPVARLTSSGSSKCVLGRRQSMMSRTLPLFFHAEKMPTCSVQVRLNSMSPLLARCLTKRA